MSRHFKIIDDTFEGVIHFASEKADTGEAAEQPN